MRQKTIKRDISCSGIGLHSGKKVTLTLRPAPEDTGIIFVQKGEQGKTMISLSPDKVISTGLATTIGHNGVPIATVEHLLGAIYGLDLDNLYVEVSGEELPIMDGSAASFVFLLRSAGIRKQGKPKKVLAFTRQVHFKDGNKWINVQPYQGLKVKYTIEFDHPMIGRQEFEFKHSPENFIRKVAKARTFGFLKDVEKLQQMGLALGGSLDNAVVLDDYGVINPEGLRFDDELVRHKILDFIGDMAVMGLPLWGAFEVHCSGHAFNNAFLRFVHKHQDDFLNLITLDTDTLPQSRQSEQVILPQPEPVLA